MSMGLRLCVCLCATYILNTHGGQNRVLDSAGSEDAETCKLSCLFWDLKLWPLKEYPVFLSDEPSFQL